MSPGQSPKLTDTEQSILGGLLRLLHPKGRLVLDRGYTGMQAACIGRRIRVSMPAFRIRLKKGQKPSTRTRIGRESDRRSRRIAKARAHNERQMSRLKVPPLPLTSLTPSYTLP